MPETQRSLVKPSDLILMKSDFENTGLLIGPDDTVYAGVHGLYKDKNSHEIDVDRLGAVATKLMELYWSLTDQPYVPNQK